MLGVRGNFSLAPGHVVRVASLAGLAMLKFFAWSDRGGGNLKDAHDLLLIMQSYGDAGNQDSLYGDEFHLLERLEYDLSLSGAYLLGKHIAHLASDETFAKLILLLESRTHADRLKTQMASRIGHSENPRNMVERYYECFINGMRTRP